MAATKYSPERCALEARRMVVTNPWASGLRDQTRDAHDRRAGSQRAQIAAASLVEVEFPIPPPLIRVQRVNFDADLCPISRRREETAESGPKFQNSRNEKSLSGIKASWYQDQSVSEL